MSGRNVLPLALLSGAAGLTYEVLWIRELAVLVGSASMAMAAVLAAVLGGIGAGTLLGGR